MILNVAEILFKCKNKPATFGKIRKLEIFPQRESAICKFLIHEYKYAIFQN